MRRIFVFHENGGILSTVVSNAGERRSTHRPIQHNRRQGYKLRYPFNEFQTAAEVCEPAENQGIAGKNGCVLPRPENKAIEPKKDNKNKDLQENVSLCSDWLGNLDSNQD